MLRAKHIGLRLIPNDSYAQHDDDGSEGVDEVAVLQENSGYLLDGLQNMWYTESFSLSHLCNNLGRIYVGLYILLEIILVTNAALSPYFMPR